MRSISIVSALLVLLFTGTAIAQLTGTATAQPKYDPALIVLSPHSVDIAPELAGKLAKESHFIDSLREAIKGEDFAAIAAPYPENQRTMILDMGKFIQTHSFKNEIARAAQAFLSYFIGNKIEEGEMIVRITSRTSDGKPEDLHSIATEHDVRYTVNFPKARFYTKEDVAYLDLSVQIYDATAKQFLLDAMFTGDYINPGFTFACEDSSLGCCINNALRAGLRDMLVPIGERTASIVNQQQLRDRRSDYIDFLLFSEAPAFELAHTFESVKADPRTMFYALTSPEKDRFIAFFTSRTGGRSYEELRDSEGGTVNIQLSEEDMRDSNAFSKAPAFYGYVVRGLKYEGKWHTELEDKSFFDAEDILMAKLQTLHSLIDYGYFADRSASMDTAFWTKLFPVVKDLRLKYDTIPEYVQTQEANDRPYIGMPEMIARVRQREARERLDSMNARMERSIFTPFFERQVTQGAIEKYNYSGEARMIHDPLTGAAILPVLITRDTSNTLEYYLYHPREKKFYRWTYFQPYPFEQGAWMISPTIVEQMSTITTWNYGIDDFDDPIFWQMFVFSLDRGGQYKHLSAVKK